MVYFLMLQDMSVLRDYMSYAKECIHPRLGDEAGQRLINAYVDMRKIGTGNGTISAYPRQLESLIRLAEAHAKVRLSETVEVVDVEEACRLYRDAVRQAATDPLTGKIDVSILTTGISSSARKRKTELAQVIKRHLEAQNRSKLSIINSAKLHAELRAKSEWVSFKLSNYGIRLVCDPAHLVGRMILTVLGLVE